EFSLGCGDFGKGLRLFFGCRQRLLLWRNASRRRRLALEVSRIINFAGLGLGAVPALKRVFTRIIELVIIAATISRAGPINFGALSATQELVVVGAEDLGFGSGER